MYIHNKLYKMPFIPWRVYFPLEAHHSCSGKVFDWLFARDQSKSSRRNCLFHYHLESFAITYQVQKERNRDTLFLSLSLFQVVFDNLFLFTLFICLLLLDKRSAFSRKLYIQLQLFSLLLLRCYFFYIFFIFLFLFLLYFAFFLYK